TRYNLWKLLGMAHGCSGRLDDAIAAHVSSLEYADDRLARATAQHGIGENYHRKGAFEEAFQHLDIALKELGFPRPTASLGIMLHTWRNSLYLYVLPRWIRIRGGPDRGRSLDIAFACYYLCIQMLSTRWMLGYVHSSLRTAAIAKESGKPEHVGVAYAK